MTTEGRVTTERHGHVLLIGLDRVAKHNAFDKAMLKALGRAYDELDSDPDLRCGVLFAHGDHFTAGLDLADVAPAVSENGLQWPEGGIDFIGLFADQVSKPVVAAVQGRCITVGIEITLASDIRIAASDALFSQIEIKRGIMPFGGATIRFIRDCGWGNA